MGKPELGLKVTCTSCACRFFDLNRTPILCPKCGTPQAAHRPRWSHSTRIPPKGWQNRPQPVSTDPITPDGASEDAGDIDPDLETIDPPDDDDDEDPIEEIPAVEEI